MLTKCHNYSLFVFDTVGGIYLAFVKLHPGLEEWYFTHMWRKTSARI